MGAGGRLQNILNEGYARSHGRETKAANISTCDARAHARLVSMSLATESDIIRESRAQAELEGRAEGN